MAAPKKQLDLGACVPFLQRAVNCGAVTRQSQRIWAAKDRILLEIDRKYMGETNRRQGYF